MVYRVTQEGEREDMKGEIRKVDKTVISEDRLESGTKVFWQDISINGLISRIPES